MGPGDPGCPAPLAWELPEERSLKEYTIEKSIQTPCSVLSALVTSQVTLLQGCQEMLHGKGQKDRNNWPPYIQSMDRDQVFRCSFTVSPPASPLSSLYQSEKQTHKEGEKLPSQRYAAGVGLCTQARKNEARTQHASLTLQPRLPYLLTSEAPR